MQFCLIFPAVLVVRLATAETSLSNVPNPSCALHSDALVCANVSIPANFSVALIPANITQIYLETPCSTARIGVHCNVLGDGAEPFPSSLVSLNTVFLSGFRSEQGSHFNFNVLLDKVKGQIVWLTIHYSKIHTLESKCFKGYRSLQRLTITTSIRVISPDAFAEMVDAGNSPLLTELMLHDNALTSFDWGVLRPIAASLKEIYLHSQQSPGLQKIFRSTEPFSLASIHRVRLDGNNLTALPKEVLETMSRTEHNIWNVVLGPNNFCPENSDCSCCAMKDLAEWAKARAHDHATVTVTLGKACGTVNRKESLYWDTGAGLPETVKNLIRDCP